MLPVAVFLLCASSIIILYGSFICGRDGCVSVKLYIVTHILCTKENVTIMTVLQLCVIHSTIQQCQTKVLLVIWLERVKKSRAEMNRRNEFWPLSFVKIFSDAALLDTYNTR